MSDFDTRAETWDENPGAVARAQQVAQSIFERIDFDRVTCALEYGAGTGLLSFALRDKLGPRPFDVLLADTSLGMLEVADRKIAAAGASGFRTQALDLTEGTTPDARFDLIHSQMTLHHIPDTASIIQTFAHLLNPGGQIAIVDLDAEDGSFHGPDIDVHHGFDRTQLSTSFANAGFTEVNVSTVFTMHRHDRDYTLFLATAQKPAAA